MTNHISKFDEWLLKGQIVSDTSQLAICEPELRQLPRQKWVSLSEAVSWIAFRCALTKTGVCHLLKLSGVVANNSAISDLSNAVYELVTLGNPKNKMPDLIIPAGDFEIFSRYHVFNDGLLCGHGVALASYNASNESEPLDYPGYYDVRVEREILFNRFQPIEPVATKVPPNRQLNHGEILQSAKAMLTDRPDLSKGAAAASIVADLPRNPKTGKPRDTRHIEKLISRLWEGGVIAPKHKPYSPRRVIACRGLVGVRRCSGNPAGSQLGLQQCASRNPSPQKIDFSIKEACEAPSLGRTT